jgi:hypothetical protein
MGMKLSASLLPALLVTPLLFAAGPVDRHGPARVTFYEHANFRGGAIVLEAGKDLDNLAHAKFNNGRRANDRISSIRIEGHAEVLVHTDCDYHGDVLRVTHDISDLGREDRRSGPRFNDRISSISVNRAARDDRPGTGRPASVDAEKIIRRAYEDILGRAPDAAGLRDFRSHIIDRNWSEKMVRDSLRASEEYRGPVTTRIIGRVYRELLGREPDPRGLEDYRRRMLDEGWTEDQVRESIRRSDEFRRRDR